MGYTDDVLAFLGDQYDVLLGFNSLLQALSRPPPFKVLLDNLVWKEARISIPPGLSSNGLNPLNVVFDRETNPRH